jgi:hypothetical protein
VYINLGNIMKLTQKTKYFTLGILAASALVPLAIYAVETIPLSFREGDIISAGVINSMLSRLNEVQKGYSSSSEIEGTWACTTYSVSNSCGTGFISTGGGVQVAKTQTIAFSCTGGVCTATASDFFPGSCNGGSTLSQTYELNGNVMASGWGVHAIQKINAAKFVWQINSSLPQQHYVACEKQNLVPAPADAVAATVSEKNVSLSWTDQSTDETGFRVERKTSAKGAWVALNTTATNAVSYSDTTGTTGTYWYRVIATNSNGDAISSSEVQAVLP